MLLEHLAFKYSKEGRRVRRSTRGQKNGLLGWLALASFAAVGYMHFSSISEEGFIATGDGEFSGRRNLELFITEPEQCQGTESWYAAPFLLIMCYSFVGLAVITDEYFEPTLALISDDLGLSSDVAGATFMAAGSSAPELLTSVVDSFFSQASVGIGTILGSAMFNLMVIVGGTALVGKAKDGGPLVIQGFPLGRDSSFYVIAIIALIGVVLNDGKLCVMAEDRFDIFVNRTDQVGKDVFCYVGLITPWEGLLLVFLYMGYILFMMYNRSIQKWWEENIQSSFCGRLGKPTYQTKPGEDLAAIQDAFNEESSKKRSDSWAQNEDTEEGSQPPQSFGSEYEPEEEEFPGNPFRSEFPNGIGGIIYWFLAFPYRLVFFLTMPVFLKEGRCRNFLMFGMNIVWITALTILMVYFATYAGCLMQVDPFIIGIIFLAIGTSVPDALASFIAASDGHGDMAVSNAVGSNVFDILLGLGLPWFISGLTFPEQVRTAEGYRGGQFVVGNGFMGGILLLLGGLFLFVGSLICFNWRMLKPIAALLIMYYVGFLVFLVLANRCKIPVCMELDCSRCGNEPSIWF